MPVYHSIILARGGSKGLKNKNILKVKNKPLLYWSIKQSIDSKKISYTWVSSDSKKILKLAKKNGCGSILRPKNISGDNASSEEAWLHAVKYLIKKKFMVDNIIGIQPTSPIRKAKDFDKAISQFENEKYDSLFTSCIINDHNIWGKNKSKILLANYNYKNRKPRQQIKSKFLENGSFYIFKAQKFLKFKCRLFGKIGTFTMPKSKSMQVDDQMDLDIINLLAKKYLK